MALLTRIFGTENLGITEDVVQDTLLQALQTWKLTGPPDNPEAWLFQVARNKAVDALRRQRHALSFDFSDPERQLLQSEYTLAAAVDSHWKEEAVEDDMLGMMFACCHPSLSGEQQVTLILKTLCGFSTVEIAGAFLTSEDNVSKRLYRAKEFFRKEKVRPEIPAAADLPGRLDPVLKSLYLLFNEGYRSTRDENPIRADLMTEAMALCKLLADNPHVGDPRVFALMALMCFHAARTPARGGGTESGLVLLPEQDRGKYDGNLISRGNAYMDCAAAGEGPSAYHIEAAIAYEHCAAPSFQATNWPRILEYYGWLCRLGPSPMAELNRVVAMLHALGPERALSELNALPNRNHLEPLALFHAVSGEIHTYLGDNKIAYKCFEAAGRLTQSEAERKVFWEKMERLDGAQNKKWSALLEDFRTAFEQNGPEIGLLAKRFQV